MTPNELKAAIASTSATTRQHLESYLEAALWTEEDTEGIEGKSIYDFSLDAITRAVEDLEEFLTKAEVIEALDAVELKDTQVGHDFWLTRNGHGAGFWDRGLGEAGDTLTNACQHREIYLYVSDDEQVEFM